MLSNQKGQSLLELIVVIAVVGLILGAFSFATISSIRNAELAQNQSKATKLAQEAIEKVRSMRDRDSVITTDVPYPGSDPVRNVNIFSELYSVFLSRNYCNNADGDGPCYFRFENNQLVKVTSTTFEINNVEPFRRQIRIEDSFPDAQSLYLYEKKITIVVQWTDFSCGSIPFCHQSQLTTILRKL
ncbi:hypothetical protein A3C59_03130 [Candidatus Daviesbacteria bacterium RIFCSPHIGHO2_02_FULL_36_13]|uniref:Uncharacterized protein n=1 Tax=Candidatus Daviesbacteria bacterium RIFCSPHIGHO2_02_FULL_36_13 TaxID=1797768 RepID=A0A1F5JPX7_9BACT|nr:MAG: hypothetical protein A3C59_03130 [Candidatus Daviesbacteria bacterium RIFCSPHIGHO2_02_FULL_36_13]OGE44661.1 MAG: hypothetical protein A3A45_02300 [Candidatus Daviesbacteria bacterium RIFCSPLOWO2_01_FULL_36_8]